jgi:hypothetical protein
MFRLKAITIGNIYYSAMNATDDIYVFLIKIVFSLKITFIAKTCCWWLLSNRVVYRLFAFIVFTIIFKKQWGCLTLKNVTDNLILTFPLTTLGVLTHTHTHTQTHTHTHTHTHMNSNNFYSSLKISTFLDFRPSDIFDWIWALNYVPCCGNSVADLVYIAKYMCVCIYIHIYIYMCVCVYSTRISDIFQKFISFLYFIYTLIFCISFLID